jgi:LETM1 and EF-hand domain-containing protein 1
MRGRARQKFYWRGVKQINANRKVANEWHARVRQGGAPLSRAETRFIKLYQQDVLKSVPAPRPR